MLFDAIGQRMGEAMRSGATVFLFGQGTLKRVRSRGASSQMRTRYRSSSRAIGIAATTTLEGLAGVANGILTDVAVVKSASAGERAILVGRPFIANAANGKITAYTDDTGMFRCVLSPAEGAVEETIVETKTAVRSWLKAAFKQLK